MISESALQKYFDIADFYRNQEFIIMKYMFHIEKWEHSHILAEFFKQALFLWCFCVVFF